MLPPLKICFPFKIRSLFCAFVIINSRDTVIPAGIYSEKIEIQYLLSDFSD
jgi:hypothetical protein